MRKKNTDLETGVYFLIYRCIFLIDRCIFFIFMINTLDVRNEV